MDITKDQIDVVIDAMHAEDTLRAFIEEHREAIVERGLIVRVEGVVDASTILGEIASMGMLQAGSRDVIVVGGSDHEFIMASHREMFPTVYRAPALMLGEAMADKLTAEMPLLIAEERKRPNGRHWEDFNQAPRSPRKGRR